MPSPLGRFPIPTAESQIESPVFPATTGREAAAPFRSILFDDCESAQEFGPQQAPEFFTDLNLGQIVDAITAGRDEYNLKPFFYVPLKREEAIHYRHDILRDLGEAGLRNDILSFADKMRKMRRCLAQRDNLYYNRQKQELFLNAVMTYCDAVGHLTDDLAHADLHSRGFRALREYLVGYTRSEEFSRLVADTHRLTSDLRAIEYSLRIDGRWVIVGRYDSEPDLSVEVLRTFDRFRQAAPKEYRFAGPFELEMNHVEAAILDKIVRLFPQVFSFVDDYCSRYDNYLNDVIARLEREVQFYIAYIEHMRLLEHAGLSFCYPRVSATSKEILGRDTFDLALADKLIHEGVSVVTNDFYLKGSERVLVVSGPNQGGKTTFARTFGQIHYLGCLGCPVPGSDVRLFLFDKLFTHFERQENLENLSGKLEDELLRIHRILEQATPNSVLIMNESFLSTTLDDALLLSKQIMQRIVSLDMLCVSVTFLDELATLSNSIVSMVSTVDPQDPAVRTFKIVRKPADGLAYAAAIAHKHRLTHDAVAERITANASLSPRGQVFVRGAEKKATES